MVNPVQSNNTAAISKLDVTTHQTSSSKLDCISTLQSIQNDPSPGVIERFRAFCSNVFAKIMWVLCLCPKTTSKDPSVGKTKEERLEEQKKKEAALQLEKAVLTKSCEKLVAFLEAKMNEGVDGFGDLVALFKDDIPTLLKTAKKSGVDAMKSAFSEDVTPIENKLAAFAKTIENKKEQTNLQNRLSNALSAIMGLTHNPKNASDRPVWKTQYGLEGPLILNRFYLEGKKEVESKPNK